MKYKLIIPKEEPISEYDVMPNIVYGENVGERIKIKATIKSIEAKQETLKEVAKRLSNTTDEFNQFIAGAKWQEQNSDKKYSEEDIKRAFEFYSERPICDIKYLDDDFNEFLKQFKNK